MGTTKMLLELHSKLLFVCLVINGKDGHFLVDTGANISVLDINQAEEYGFTHQNVDKSVTGIGGKWSLYEAMGVEVKHEDQPLEINFMVNDLSHVNSALKEYVNLVGIIGGDFLVQNNVQIDYRENIMVVDK